MAQTEKNILYRPPIVTIMGHIDHGKTSLLDKIRSTTLWRKEAGGITQHIGAYQVKVTQKNGKTSLITFIDTPGHAAFCNMRTRGSQVTDIVVLVISAVDGVMAQTKECIDLVKKSNLPLIVAINKIDLEGSNPDKVKGQLVELGYTPEDYGGQLACIPVSAKTGQGIPELLDMILLNSELLELKSEDNSPLEAVVIESKLDKNRGPVASIIVKKGKLSVGDIVYSEGIYAKVKAMIDYLGQIVKVATPGTPVEILGFEKSPPIGGLITSDKATTTQGLKNYNPKLLLSAASQLPVIIKADVEGTLEAILGSFSNDVLIIFAGVGPVSDNDVFLAQASNAEIFAFNTSVPKFVKNLADNSHVKIFESKIIYEIIEDIQDQVLKMLEPTIDETITGEGLIKAEFKIEKVRIAGVQCTKGELSKGDQVHLKRDGKIIKDTKIEGLRQAKLVVDKIKSGSDCGLTFKPYVDFKINDVIISYKKGN